MQENNRQGKALVINCAVSFWVYFPILKLIFKK